MTIAVTPAVDLRHGRDMVYSHPERVWRIWSGSHWPRDESGQSRANAEAVAKEFIRQVRAALSECAEHVAGPARSTPTSE